MTKAEVRNQALRLSERERLALAEELWASIEDPNTYPEASYLPQWQKDLLDQRLEESQGDPGKPWEQVKAEIWPADS
jgi:putative addiction module component (TIGR02574 family)